MIGRRQLPPNFQAWNRKWNAPWGRWAKYDPSRSLRGGRSLGNLLRRWPRLAGPFGLTSNNDTRAFEYPWAFHAARLERGMSVVELGGGRSGFQFVLAKEGMKVVNVDPGEGDSDFWVTQRLMQKANRAFRTNVELIPRSLEDAGLDANSIDRIFCISTLEHIPEANIESLMREVARVLKPSGLLVATVDLFLDLQPFTAATQNRWGTNVSVRRMLDWSGLALLEGDPRELNGFDEFSATEIQTNLADYFYGAYYPAVAQALVAVKSVD